MDPLQGQLDALVAYLKERSVPVVYGFLPDETDLLEISMTPSETDDANRSFRELAVTLGAKFVVLGVQRLEMNEVEDAVESAAEAARREAILCAHRSLLGFGAG